MKSEQGTNEAINLLARFKDKKLEKDFHNYNMKAELSFYKWFIVVSGFAYLLFLFHDYYYIPDGTKFVLTLIIRVTYFLWSMAFFLLYQRVKSVNILGKMISFTILFFIYTQLQILYLLKYQNFDSHSLMILIIYLCYSAASSDWLSYTISIIVCTVFYFWSSALYLENYSMKDYVTAGVYFALAIIFCSLANYRSCMYKRLLYNKSILMEQIKRVEQERNQLLETEKQQAVALLNQEQIISKVNKMAYLRSQIKPHFIYNALNTIELLCYQQPEKAGELVLQLSKYLSYCFDFDREEQFLPFDKELDLIRAYVEIEKARFSDSFILNYDLCDTTQLYIPPLTIQPLIENAIKHGVGRKNRQDTILLRITESKDDYNITVEDNGVGINKEKLELLRSYDSADGVGLSNIQNRLWELYGEKLEIISEVGVGTKISFKIKRYRR